MKRSLLFLIAATALAGIATYNFNPSTTASFDPRARIFGFIPYRIPAASMSPTVQPGDYVVVSTFAYWSDGPEHGDVIAFRYPVDPSQIYLKRIVAVSGDLVELRNHDLIVNGEKQNEPYASHQTRSRAGQYAQFKVPERHYFVMGDNRDNSLDSRMFGPVPRAAVIGRAAYIWLSDSDNTGPIK